MSNYKSSCKFAKLSSKIIYHLSEDTQNSLNMGILIQLGLVKEIIENLKLVPTQTILFYLLTVQNLYLNQGTRHLIGFDILTELLDNFETLYEETSLSFKSKTDALNII